MRVAYIADARSPFAQNWIHHFIESGYDIHVISSYPCSPAVFSGAKVYQFPIAFSQFARSSHNRAVASRQKPSFVSRGLAGLRTGRLSRISMTVFPWVASLEIGGHVEAARELSFLVNTRAG